MSVENYQKEMIMAKTSNSNLDGLTSTSKTSVWRMMLYIMAFSVEQLAQLFSVHRSEIDTKISTQKTHRLPWIQSLYLNFQYGFQLIKEKDLFDNTGAKEVTLTTEQMPKHKHSGSVDSAGAHSHYLVVNEDSGWNDYPTSSTHISKKSRSSDNSENYRLTKPKNSSLSPSLGKSSESGIHTHNLTLDDTGENKAHENRPPFYVLAKII